MSRFRHEKKSKRRSRHEVPFRTMIPNLLTFLAATAGVTAIRYASVGRWKAAVAAILTAAIFDGMDGRVARMLSATSKLGAELDSLSDFVSFGVAPAMLTYFWMMQSVGEGTAYWAFRGVFWTVSIFYAMCGAFRLARFNIMIESGPSEPYWKHFFVGVPAPGGALLVLLPVLFSLALGVDQLPYAPILGTVSLLVCGLLLACRIPTICAKHLHIPRRMLLPIVLIVIFYAGMLVSQLWETLIVTACCYYLSVPLCGLVFLRMKRRYERERAKVQ